MKTLTVGILIDGEDQPGWIRDVIAWVRARSDIDCTVLIAREKRGGARKAPSHPRTSLFYRGLARLESKLLAARERVLINETAPVPDLQSLSHYVVDTSCDDHGVMTVSDASLAGLSRAAPLDLVIALGMPVLRGTMVRFAPMGLWQLSYADVTQVCDRHAGFWQVMSRADHTSVKLWRMGGACETDALIESRTFNTEVFWLKNHVRSLSLGNLMLFDALKRLTHTPAKLELPAALQGEAVDLRDRPDNWQSAAYLVRQTALMTNLMWMRMVRKNVTWRIGMCADDRGQPVSAPAEVLTAPKGSFYADPFVYTHEGKPYIFFEDYAFNEGKGKISAATYIDGRFTFLGVVLDLPYHLSFPYIFEHDGTIFMMPETCGNRTIELWKCVEFPLKWELASTLMNDVSAVDSIIFPREGRWWLLTNIDRANGYSHSDELFAFYADSPTSTSWTAHQANPVVRSPSRARNAGIVVSPTGELTRCAQYQGFCHYGKGVSLNRIVTLTPDEYVETEGPIHYARLVKRSRPSMHHCHHNNGMTVFDFAYLE